MARRALKVEADAEEESGPQPRTTLDVLGHSAAEAAVLEAWNQGRFPHAWLIAGPRGIGKATLAFRIARFLLSSPEVASDGLFGATGPDSLVLPPCHPVVPLVAIGAHPDLRLIERQRAESGKLSTVIRIEDVRGLANLFGLTRNDSWRVVIIDGAEDMNRNAANAVLKMLEEPPARCCFLLVSHAPARLLPTIRSRCRRLDLKPVPDALVTDVLATQGATCTPAVLALSHGAPGRAMLLAQGNVDQMLDSIDAALAGTLDTGAEIALADSLSGRDGQGAYELYLELFPERMADRLRDRLGHNSGDFEPAFALLDRARTLCQQAAPLSYDSLLVIHELGSIARTFSKMV